MVVVVFGFITGHKFTRKAELSRYSIFISITYVLQKLAKKTDVSGGQ